MEISYRVGVFFFLTPAAQRPGEIEMDAAAEKQSSEALAAYQVVAHPPAVSSHAALTQPWLWHQHGTTRYANHFATLLVCDPAVRPGDGGRELDLRREHPRARAGGGRAAIGIRPGHVAVIPHCHLSFIQSQGVHPSSPLHSQARRNEMSGLQDNGLSARGSPRLLSTTPLLGCSPGIDP